MSVVLVIGSGGREHALAWKLSQSKRVSRVIVAPGNDGMEDWERWPADFSKKGPSLQEEFTRLAERALAQKVALVVVGPDNPLADGIVDVFTARGLACFGPTAAAAQIEASKAFAKEVMHAAQVPTARYHLAEGREQARQVLESLNWDEKNGGSGWVIKADGLALGKGVHVCGTLSEGLQAIETLCDAGYSSRFVIEERLTGEELSWMAFCDGKNCSLLEPARDHKRLGDGDQGPNTGGMGAYSPVPGIPADWERRVREEVFLPTLAEMARRGTPFQGLLYAGLMVDVKKDRFWVLEFNARFGDPETQVLLPRMADDLYHWCNAVARHNLSDLSSRVAFVNESAVAVVAAARGYPEAPEKGAPIRLGKSAAPQCFFAGVARREGRLVTQGGRVLAVVGMGGSLSQARELAYQNLKSVQFEGMHFRNDIAQNAARGNTSGVGEA